MECRDVLALRVCPVKAVRETSLRTADMVSFLAQVVALCLVFVVKLVGMVFRVAQVLGKFERMRKAWAHDLSRSGLPGDVGPVGPPGRDGKRSNDL